MAELVENRIELLIEISSSFSGENVVSWSETVLIRSFVFVINSIFQFCVRYSIE